MEYCITTASLLILMQVDEVCLYKYAVDQQFGNGSGQNLSFSATVEIGCHSGTIFCYNVHVKSSNFNLKCTFTLAVGEFNETSATQFCMTVTDVDVNGFAFNDTTNKNKE